MFPPIPEWDALHPLVVHFPVALLLGAPVFMVIALSSPRLQRSFASAALIMMVMGTIAAYVAVETGEAAAELAVRSGGVGPVLERHEDLAETTTTLFSILCIVFAVITIGPLFLKKPIKRAYQVLMQVVFLLGYLGCTVVLANTAHQGGRLVHEFGVHAFVAPEVPVTPPHHDDD